MARLMGSGKEVRCTSYNNQLPASFASLTTTITARVREPRRQHRTLGDMDRRPLDRP